MTIGIYCIKCTRTGQVYIGQSINIENRIKKHFYDLEHNKHVNEKIQRAFNVYGIDAFEHTMLEECERDKLNHLEDYYMKKYDSIESGFNIKSGSLKYINKYDKVDEYEKYITSHIDFSYEDIKSRFYKNYNMGELRYLFEIYQLHRLINVECYYSSDLMKENILHLLNVKFFAAYIDKNNENKILSLDGSSIELRSYGFRGLEESNPELEYIKREYGDYKILASFPSPKDMDKYNACIDALNNYKDWISDYLKEATNNSIKTSIKEYKKYLEINTDDAETYKDVSIYPIKLLRSMYVNSTRNYFTNCFEDAKEINDYTRVIITRLSDEDEFTEVAVF